MSLPATLNVTFTPPGAQVIGLIPNTVVYAGTSGDASLVVLALNVNGKYEMQVQGLNGNDYLLVADGDSTLPEGEYTDGTVVAIVGP
ncbi:MAG: hypothetical protein AAF911_02100 [Planctomycetota bacterium]